MAGTDEAGSLARTCANIARALLAQGTLQQTLDSIVRLAVELIHGCEAAAISLVCKGHRAVTRAASSAWAWACDDNQVTHNQGPAMDVIRGGSMHLADDLSQETRWPAYTPIALRLGVASMISIQLCTDARTLGSLTLYAARPHAFTSTSRETGSIFATHAAIALTHVQREEQLHEALTTRQTIGQATGILMERHHLTPEAAFSMLSQASQELNTKLRTVAAHVCYTGEEPITKKGLRSQHHQSSV